MSDADLNRILTEIRADIHVLGAEFAALEKFQGSALERERWLQHQIDVMAGRLAVCGTSPQ